MSGISWSPAGHALAIAYCNLEFQAIQCETPKFSYVFSLEDPVDPLVKIQPPCHLVSLEYNPREPFLLAGGCYNGQVLYIFLNLREIGEARLLSQFCIRHSV